MPDSNLIRLQIPTLKPSQSAIHNGFLTLVTVACTPFEAYERALVNAASVSDHATAETVQTKIPDFISFCKTERPDETKSMADAQFYALRVRYKFITLVDNMFPDLQAWKKAIQRCVESHMSPALLLCLHMKLIIVSPPQTHSWVYFKNILDELWDGYFPRRSPTWTNAQKLTFRRRDFVWEQMRGAMDDNLSLVSMLSHLEWFHDDESVMKVYTAPGNQGYHAAMLAMILVMAGIIHPDECSQVWKKAIGDRREENTSQFMAFKLAVCAFLRRCPATAPEHVKVKNWVNASYSKEADGAPPAKRRRVE